ncbi:hypothetical protein RND81_10G011600 [Saponaria officinalis]|uniref:Uncharacterized protein n=1 Tax=Saponaria officinalis TaxID=3572 RepID=A0AAW1HX59_SAPOF
MSQQSNQGTSIASPSDSRSKRKRGRPRKDETQPSPPDRPILRPVASQVDADVSVNDDCNNDQMVGQVVTGVLERAFDAGYFLSVRVGDSDMYMRGVVFKDGSVVPVTPENDIAPNVRMYTRRDLPVPVSFAHVDDKPTEDDRNAGQQPEPPAHDVGQRGTNTETVDNLSTVGLEKETGIVVGVEVDEKTEIVPREENVSNKSEDEKTEIVHREENVPNKSEDEKTEIAPGEENDLNKPEDEKTEIEPSTDVAQEGNQAVLGEDNVVCQIGEAKDEGEKISDLNTKEDCSERPNLEESIESPAKIPAKIQKTDAVTSSNVQTSKETSEIGISLNDPVEPTVAEKEICGISRFQISMENTDADDLVSEQPTEFRADLEESIEPPEKIRKTDEVTETVTCSNVQTSKETSEIGISLNDPVEPTVAEKEICGNSGFQISMENTDADDLVSEQPTEFRAMETE